MLPELTAEECSAALDSVAAAALDEAEFGELPVDAIAVAKSLGLSVVFQAKQESRAQIVRLGGYSAGPAQTSISLRPDPRSEREQWAVAHEIGEHLAQRVFALLDVDPRTAPRGAREQIANRLAGRILLPRELFADLARAAEWDLLELKRQFTTASHELIARRMLDFPQPLIITIMDQGQQSFRGSNQSGRLPAMNRWEQQAWQSAGETGQPARAGNRHWQVRAWPIHENSWRREILRTTWNVEDDMEDCFS